MDFCPAMASHGCYRDGVLVCRVVVKNRRHIGFWLFLLSNVLWVVWGIYSAAPALVVLQVALAAMNIRGAKKTD